MIRSVVSEGFFLRIAPRGCSAVVCVLEADYMVYVDKVTGSVCVEAYGCRGFVATIVEVFAVITVGKGEWDCSYCY
jgi:hypothetical protein